MSTQRLNVRSLPDERRKRLDALGFVWDPIETDWNKGFRYLTAYEKREGHCHVPASHIENGFKLGFWVSNQRRSRNGDLSDEKRQRLDELGFIWDALETRWERGVRHLKSFVQREGHCRVPYEQLENGFGLGVWVSHQRRNIGAMPAEWRQRLDELGFLWDARENTWDENFAYLKAYVEREGHCRVPARHRENGFKLGLWVRNQRNKDNMSEERRRRLDELGFVWKVR